MKRLRRITLISFIGLLLSFGLWWVSFWNFDYCLESPYRISLNHGSITWNDWRAYEQDRKWPAGIRKIGYNGLTTLWKPHFLRRSGNLVVVTMPIWMAVVVFGLLYYGLSVVGVSVGLFRQYRGRCRECGRRLSDTLLCCRACQTPVSMMTVGRRALGQFALHGFVITVGATLVSYFHFSATPAAGASIGLTRGALSIGWGSNARPGMSLAGYTDMKTLWLPSRTSSIVNAAAVPISTPPLAGMPINVPSIPIAPVSVVPSPSFNNPTGDELRELLSQYLAASPTPEQPPLSVDDMTLDIAYSLDLYNEQSVAIDRPWTTPAADDARVDRDGLIEVTPETVKQIVSNRPVRPQPAPPPAAPLAAAVVPARTFLFPLWVPLLVFGYATWRLRFAPANLQRRRRKLGLCLRCGYDLRASEGRCPECGSEFESLGV